jgi:hypothetical protein
MAAFTAGLLSGTPASGRAIPVVATASPGTLLHTAVTGSVAFDEVFLWATNVTANPVTITIEWGGVLNPGDHVAESVVVPSNSPPFLLLDGLRLNGGLQVTAYASVANAINVTGQINRIQ